MSSYTITITPDDTTRASTTLRVDVTENTPRITELQVRAGTATGLSAQQLPAVDLDLLLRAVTPGTVPTSIQAAAERAAKQEPLSVVSPAGGDTPAGTRRASARSGRRAAATQAPRRKRAAAKQTEAKAAKRATKSARTAEPAKSAKSTRAAKATGGERAYRRAPADLVQVYESLGGATAVAKHYQVPRYTAQSWIRRLRNEGRLPAGE